MRENFGQKTWLYPMPVLIICAYDENGVPNAMNAAWGGISEENEISICISEDHKTTYNIIKSKAFTISIGEECNVIECDYLGIETGNKVENKLERASLTTTKSEFVNAPIINEFSMALECELISYNPETCTLKGKIKNISIDEKVLGENGKLSLEKFKPITYDPVNHNYIALGKIVGNAFKDGLKLK